MLNKKHIATYMLVALGVVLSSLNESMASTWFDLDEDDSYTARHEASFVQAGDRFYLFGGREDPQVLDTYDYVSDVWTTSASTPIPFNHFQATEYQGLIWVIGAFKDNRFPREAPAENIYIFDPANDLWIKGPEIPADRRRGSTGLVEYQGVFYVVGGNTVGHNGGYVSWFDSYNPETGEWTNLADAPSARDHFHASLANEKLYVAGGRLSGGSGGVFAPLIATVDVFDFVTNSWRTLPTSSNLPTPRAGTSTVTFQDKVVVIGGEGNGQAYDTVEQLDPETNLWTQIASLNHARHGTQAIVSGDGIFVAVGSPRQGGGNQHNLEAFNSNIPIGTPNTAGSLLFSEEAMVISNSEVHDVHLLHGNGNQGVIISSIELVGENVESFELIENGILPALVPVGGVRTISVKALNNIDSDVTAIEVTYSDGQTLSIPIRYSKDDDFLLYVIPSILAALKNKVNQ